MHKSHEKEVTQILLDAGANVNARNLCGNTPLHESLCKEVTQILLDAGANPFIKDNYGRTARDCTHDKERKQLLKKAEDKYKYKAMGVGAICGVIAGLAVGGGCFAAGLSLLISAFIGAAVAIAIGFVVFGITYAMSKQVPSEKLDSVDAEQKASTAASMVV